jgi:dCMP deaminase
VTATSLSLFSLAAEALNDLRNLVPEYERITDDEQGVLAAFAFALRADCTRRRVGAVGVDRHGRVIGTGRNGAPPGRPGCLTAGACPRGRLSYDQIAAGSTYSAGSGACIALHAEVNCTINSASPDRRLGGTVYVTDAPCDDCSKHLAGSGWARVVWPERHDDGTWTVRSYDLSGPIGGHYS